MPTTKKRFLIEPPPPDYTRVYLARGTDLDYVAKRAADGKIVSKSAERADVKHEAELLGYTVI